jgi:adenosine deaminase
MATPASSGRNLRTLPKAHLHLHLEGGMRPGTLSELAARYGEPAPKVQPGGDFATFEAGYRAASRLLRAPSDVERLVLELAEDGAAAGAVWIEPSAYVTDDRAQASGLTSAQSYLEFLLDAARRAEQRTGVGVGLILAANRARGPEEANRMAKLASSYSGRGVVAFGLMGDEAAGAPETFCEAFRVIRSADLIAAPHAGELAGPTSVRGSLDSLGAARIQHGVRSIEDPELVERLARAAICLDVCPTSNVFLTVTPEMSAHPLPQLVAAEVQVSVNADDPLFFGSSLLDEYELCRDRFGMEDAKIAGIAASSIRASGAPEHLKRVAIAHVDDWLKTPLKRDAQPLP